MQVATLSYNPRVQILSGLPPEDMSHITAHARSLRKARGEFIYMPGDRADFVYILKQGRIKLERLDPRSVSSQQMTRQHVRYS